MGLRMFGRKNVFFEKTHHNKNENNSAQQAQQKDTDTNTVREQLIQKEILRNNEQKKD